MFSLRGESRKVVALDGIEVRERDRELFLTSTGRRGAKHCERCRLHRLLGIVHEQYHIDGPVSGRVVGADVCSGLRGVTESFAVDEH